MPKPLTMWITTNRKILKELGIPDHLTYLLRNIYAGQEATVRPGHGTDWFQIGKGVCPLPLSPKVRSTHLCLFCCLAYRVIITIFHGGTWDSPVGKPRGKASRESHRSLDPCQVTRYTAATAREESARACPHSRRGLSPLGRLQKYPKIHVTTGDESSGSGTHSTQYLRLEKIQEVLPSRRDEAHFR